MKKVYLLLLTLVILLTSCSRFMGDNVEGSEIINKARDNFIDMESGQIIMKDKSTDKVIHDLTFKITNNVMTYLYYGTIDDFKYTEYHNGSELYYKNNDEDWSCIKKGDDNFFVYTAKDRHLLATENTLFYMPSSIEFADVVQSDDITTVSYAYDTEKLGRLNASLLSGEILKEFTTTYVIKDDYVVKMEQCGVIADSDVKYEYVLLFDKINDVGEISKP